MSELKIDYDEVERVISGLRTSLSTSGSDLSDAYSQLAGLFAESCGEEADALREIQQAETGLLAGVGEFLDAFANNIQASVNEFRGLDSSSANQMGIKGK